MHKYAKVNQGDSRLWMATYQGLYCFFNRGFTNHRLADRDDIVRALAVDGNDRLVMGSLNGKVIADGKIVVDQPDNFYAPGGVTIDGKVYMVGNGDVVCYDGSLHRLGLPHDRYQFVGKAGNRLIIGSRKCIAAYHPESGAVDTLSTEIPHPWCAAEDSQGRLWVGSTFGLFVDGRPYDYAQKLIVTTMERDAQGNILFASKDSLFMILDGQVAPLAMPELAGHEVRSLHVSPKGYLVLAVIDGLFVSRFGQDCNIADTRFFDHNNGFTVLEPLMAMMAETSDGTIWLAGVEEMSSFSPERLLDYHPESTFIAPPLRWWQHWWVAFQRTDTILTGLGKLEKTLSPQIFVRADRSTLVNIHNISHLNAKLRTCTFKSADGIEVETTLLAPAFKRLEAML